MNDLDNEYALIAENVDWEKPEQHVEKLRALVSAGHAESMNLLAIILGDIDSKRYRSEIISLYEHAYKLGSSVAANGMAIQYSQWNEPLLSRIWERRAQDRIK